MTRMQSPLGLQLQTEATEALLLESEIKISSGQENTDPIWAANTVQHDLLLLENQIPFFVLEKLFRLTVDRIQNNRPRKLSLHDYVFHYFGNIVSPEENSTSSGGGTAPTSRGSPGDSTVLRISVDDEMKSSEEDGVLTSNGQRYYHILHKLHEYCRPKTKQAKEKVLIEIMPCASELAYAAVKFEPVPVRDLFKVEFSDPKGPFWWCQTARFKIPVLEIYDNTELFLRNLIAFEQCCPKVSQHFTSYALLMDMLVNSGRDVQLLERAGVMRNHLGSRADATNLFNNLCKGVVPGEFFFADMCSKATAYSKRRWPKNLAHIRRTYLSSPWSFIAFCVAFIAFGIQIVTFVQSFL
ncbi:hypothetical protein RHMOL_Rhmol05G0295200 [Rhododendron molle]|uniref:Uncharacterized protein n=1 Tax=Rhododendron molle TaxID=49168 RepID=A0ACC0NWN3_RHOML|nr:hypothetical protein RHMOL_Rhmol05G0295200 [Rhododendron molle]